MLGNLEAVVFEVDELTLLVREVVRYASREDGDAGVCPHAIKGVFVERDHSFKRVVPEDALLARLLLTRLACQSRLRDDD